MGLKTNIIFILLFLLVNLTSCANEEITITIKIGDDVIVVDKEAIINHNEAITFPAVVRSSGEKPVETEYRGVELSKLLYSNNIDISSYSKITFNASDGYRIIMSAEEIKEPQNVYLTFERDGEVLKTKKQGGNGPFQLVIRRDPFSQRWIKHLNEIILE